MKKIFFMTLLAGLFLLPGCNEENSPSTPKVNKKGAVYVLLKTYGLASDIISVKVTINGEQKALLSKNDTLYELYGIDPQQTTHVQVEPIFAEVTPPTEEFNFYYTYYARVGLSEGKDYPIDPYVGTVTKDTMGNKNVKPEYFDKRVNEAKTYVIPIDATIANGEVK